MKPELISKMKANLRGRVILPGDQDYNEARKVYNGMIDKHPKLIVRCDNVADVRLAVEFARENDLLVAVRGGCHNGAGLATCDDGMVIDLSQMKGVRFDPSLSTIRAEPGCTQGDVNHLGRSFDVFPAGVGSEFPSLWLSRALRKVQIRRADRGAYSWRSLNVSRLIP
jgi:FAD/FMN-containing dehydrogenase